MSTGPVLNASATVPGELFGISGNLLAVLIILAGVLIAVVIFLSSDGFRKKLMRPRPRLTISLSLP